MCSSKEKGNGPDGVSSETRPEPANRSRGLTDSSRRRWWLLGLALCVVAAVPASWYGLSVYTSGNDRAELLTEARDLLAAVSRETGGKAQRQRAEQAGTLLRRYLDSGGKQVSTANLLLCVSLCLQGTLDEFDDRFRQVDPTQCETIDLSTAAFILFSAGRGRAADELLDEALARNTDDRIREKILRAAVTVRYDLGREMDVLEHCRELAELAPDDPRPWMVIALVHEDRGEWLHAARNYRKVVRRAQERVHEYRRVLIDFLIKAGEIKEARRELEILKSKAPQLAAEEPLLEARLLRLEGESQQALAIAKRVVEDNPQNGDAQLLRGQILFADSRYEQAAAALARAAEAKPLSHEVHYLLGNAYRRLGNSEKSKHHFDVHQRLSAVKQQIFRLERAAGRNPTDVKTRRKLVELYEEVGAPERAAFWRRAVANARSAGGGRPAGTAIGP